MGKYDDFYKKLTDNPSVNTTLRIKREEKKIKGMVKLTTKNYAGSEYIKITFTDGSFLLVMIDDKELYYADKLIGRISEIDDEVIGKESVISYNGKKYKLENKNDYQYVVQRYVGTPKDVEGEVRFSDYFPTSGVKEFLSLGWLSETGERADISCALIDIRDVEIV